MMILAVLVLASCSMLSTCSSTRWSMSLLCAGAVHRKFRRPCGHARPALSSSLGGLTPHSARSSNRARQWQLIRAELPSNGYPQPSGSSKNARQWHFIRAERSSKGSCRSHRALEGSSLPSVFVPFVFFPRLATPALRLGVIGSLRPSVFCVDLAGSVNLDGKKIGTSSLNRIASSCPASIVPNSGPLTTALGLNDDSGTLSWLDIVGFEEDFTLFLRFMTTCLLQFHFTDSEIFWMMSV